MIKKADIVLLIIILVVGIPLSVLSLTEGIGGDKVRISLDGEIYGVYPLCEDREIDVTEDGHTNHITIKDGQVSMSYSTCRNQVCVNTGAISETKDAIVCLPNRVVVEIISSDSGSIGKGGDADVMSG